jgi:predicted nucleotidyltransferase
MLLETRTLEALSPFLERDRLTASEVARDKHLNQKSVANLLNRLEDEGILSSTREGRNKLFSVKRNERSVSLLVMLEHEHRARFFAEHPTIERIAEELTENLDDLSLIFGSQAKGTQTEASDIDLFVLGAPSDELKKLAKRYSVTITNRRNLSDTALITQFNRHVVLTNAERYVREVRLRNSNDA